MNLIPGIPDLVSWDCVFCPECGYAVGRAFRERSVAPEAPCPGCHKSPHTSFVGYEEYAKILAAAEAGEAKEPTPGPGPALADGPDWGHKLAEELVGFVNKKFPVAAEGGVAFSIAFSVHLRDVGWAGHNQEWEVIVRLTGESGECGPGKESGT